MDNTTEPTTTLFLSEQQHILPSQTTPPTVVDIPPSSKIEIKIIERAFLSPFISSFFPNELKKYVNEKEFLEIVGGLNGFFEENWGVIKRARLAGMCCFVLAFFQLFYWLWVFSSLPLSLLLLFVCVNLFLVLIGGFAFLFSSDKTKELFENASVFLNECSTKSQSMGVQYKIDTNQRILTIYYPKK